jgi:hypothetical protein
MAYNRIWAPHLAHSGYTKNNFRVVDLAYRDTVTSTGAIVRATPAILNGMAASYADFPTLAAVAGISRIVVVAPTARWPHTDHQ